MTLAEWEDLYKRPGLSRAVAHSSRLPFHTGDGYAWGGGSVVTIGSNTIVIGEGDGAAEFAAEIARRWNAALPPETE